MFGITKKDKFKKDCSKLRRELKNSWRKYRSTRGLCDCITSRIGWRPSEWFNEEFRGQSPYPHAMFWLGSRYRKECYKIRLEYLKKFKKLAIKEKKYLAWY